MKTKIFIISIFLICLSNSEILCQSTYILAGDTNSNNIIYHDFNPNKALINDSISIDIDNDGIYDYKFFQLQYETDHSNDSTKYIRIRCLNENEISVDSLPAFKFYGMWCDTLNLNDTINSTLNWLNYNSSYNNSEFNLTAHIVSMGGLTHEFGFWYNLKLRYLGFRLKKESSFVYGWIQMSIGNSNKLEIDRYAYNSVKLGLGNNYTQKTIRIFPNPCNDRLIIAGLKSQNSKYQFRIIDLMGNFVYNQAIENVNNTEINIANLNTGIYFIKIVNETNNIVLTDKIIKK